MICPILDNDEQTNCIVEGQFRFNILFSKMYGDLTYGIHNASIVRIANVSVYSGKPNVSFDATSYVMMLDLLYGEQDDSEVLTGYLSILNTAILFGAYDRGRFSIVPVILPILLQQQLAPKPENLVNASIIRESYIVSVLCNSVYLFTFLSILTYGWCVVLVVSTRQL